MTYSQKAVINNLRSEKGKLEDTLETVKEFVLIRRDDIEKDLENFGMLKPILNYFLKEEDEHLP